MIALYIKDLKPFMHELFLTPTFDHFLVPEACITTFSTFQIDGSLEREYYTTEELEQIPALQEQTATWSQLRPICFQLIRGKKTPLNMKIIFRLPVIQLEKLLSRGDFHYTSADVGGLYLNIHFNGTSLSCTTGTSMRMFTLDKSLEQEWDRLIQKFFLTQNLSFSTEP